jgi:predicted transcriptional regulator
MLTDTEKEILRKINQVELIDMIELKSFVNGNVNAVLNSLTAKGFVNEIRPLGSTSYVITQKGKQFLRDL